MLCWTQAKKCWHGLIGRSKTLPEVWFKVQGSRFKVLLNDPVTDEIDKK
jgi:hypothetical protein